LRQFTEEEIVDVKSKVKDLEFYDDYSKVSKKAKGVK